ncbi:MAG: hypothetical protein P1S46_06185 [bacterium]|nr:hypothetical protein [bacterium]
MSGRKIKRIRRQLKKFEKKKLKVTLDALREIAALPLRQRLWFAWRIVVVRRFG